MRNRACWERLKQASINTLLTANVHISTMWTLSDIYIIDLKIYNVHIVEILENITDRPWRADL